MSRITSPRQALDYPHLDDDLFVIWSGNEHLWPDARRQTHYLTDRRDTLRGYALFNPFPEGARTFETEEAAQTFLDEMNALRPAPYHSVQVTTVSELKVARGYAEPEPEPDLSPSP